MQIKTVTIVVRGERGEIKKAVYNGAGDLMSGDVSILEEAKWEPKTSAPAPLSPEQAAESLRKATASESASPNVIDLPLSNEDIPDEDVELPDED